MTKSYLQDLLRSKLPDSSEVELHLFELCNLRCHFCGQDHDDRTGFDLIRSKIAPVKEFISQNPKKSHIVNVMGGELFNDELPDAVFADYYDLATEVAAHAASLGHTCTFNWVTNLIFQKHPRVSALLDRLRAAGVVSNLSTSYDFAGRKNSLWNEEVFRKNLERYRSSIFTVGFVLTRPAIQKLLREEDAFFRYLYAHYPLYFDYYVPEAGAATLMPSDREILDVYRFIAKHYPRISPVKELIENEQNKMTCYSLNKLTLLPNGREVKCRYVDYKEGDFRTPVDYQSNENIIEAHLEENECLSCQWFERCSFRCFVQADWAKREKTAECLFKTFFGEIERGTHH